VLGSVQCGARLVLARLFEASNAMRVIEAERVTHMIAVPTMVIAMLEAHGRQRRDTGSLREVMSGGAMVPPELALRAQNEFGCGITIIYGQTEASPGITQTRQSDGWTERTETIGQPYPQTEVSIRDIASNNVLLLGAVGEICTRGYCVMREYNDNPEATSKAIDGERWLHTGDLGTMDERGYVRITGRVKDMLIRGGENIFPAEIENVLMTHPGVAEVAVAGVPDSYWGEVAVAFVRVRAGAELERADLVEHVRRELAAPKTPAQWVVLEAFPLTGSGKIQKFVLRENYLAGMYAGRELA
jgi:fatty-acyl-CoA synthase